MTAAMTKDDYKVNFTITSAIFLVCFLCSSWSHAESDYSTSKLNKDMKALMDNLPKNKNIYTPPSYMQEMTPEDEREMRSARQILDPMYVSPTQKMLENSARKIREYEHKIRDSQEERKTSTEAGEYGSSNEISGNSETVKKCLNTCRRIRSLDRQRCMGSNYSSASGCASWQEIANANKCNADCQR